MLTVSPALVGALNINYRREFIDGLAKADPFYPQVAMVVNSNTSVENYINIGDFPKLEEWIGKRQIKELKAVDWAIKNRKFEGTLRVPVTAIEDDQFGFYNNIAKGLGDSAARLPDELIANLLEAGFTANGYDGTTFFSTTHAGDDGTNQSNKGTTALSAASYEVARAQLRNLTNAQGKKLGLVPGLLIVPPSLEGTAKRIVVSEYVATAAGTASETNPNAGTARVLVVNALTDTNDWFLMVDNQPLKPFIWQQRQAPVITAMNSPTADNVFWDDELVWGARARGNAGYALWQTIFGAKVA